AGWEHYVGECRAAFEATMEQQLERVRGNAAPAFTDRLAGARSAEAPGEPPSGELHTFPLVTRGKVRGALLLALGPSSRRLQGQDLSLAESLAGRAAASLDNCLLYEEIQN